MYKHVSQRLLSQELQSKFCKNCLYTTLKKRVVSVRNTIYAVFDQPSRKQVLQDGVRMIGNRTKNWLVERPSNGTSVFPRQTSRLGRETILKIRRIDNRVVSIYYFGNHEDCSRWHSWHCPGVVLWCLYPDDRGSVGRIRADEGEDIKWLALGLRRNEPGLKLRSADTCTMGHGYL